MAPSRIEELRRRVQADPASIAFAQLAEEYRRSGQTDEAVRVCQEGLTRHPGYLSARVTLGRALLDLSQLDAARAEFEFVVAEAPENLAAVRGLAEISQRDGQLADALNYYRRALALARHDPEIEEIVQQLSRQVGVAASSAPGGLSFEEAHHELLSAAERVPVVAPRPAPVAASDAPTAPFDFDRLVAALGSPTAPPQLEAAVAGRPTSVPALELADTIDLGPNPFAALEAELRAHAAAPTAASMAAESSTPAELGPVESAETGRYEASAARAAGEPLVALLPDSAEAVLEDTLLADVGDMALVAVDEASEAPEPFEEAPTVAVAVAGVEAIGSGTAHESPEPASPEPSATAIAFAPSAADASPEAEASPVEAPAALAIAADAPDAAPAPHPVEASALVATAVDAQSAAPATSGNVLDDLESWLDTLHDRTSS